MAEQQKPSVAEFSDAELIELANDPSVTAQELAKLTPSEQRRFMSLRQSTPQGDSSGAVSKMADALDAVGNFGVGAAKGLGESVFNLGASMKDVPSDILIPGMSAITGRKTLGDVANWIGPEGTNAERAFAQTPPELAAQGRGENVGKTVEQVAEFFLPAGKVGPLARGSANLVGKLPKAAGPVRRMATDAAWKAAPIADDALGAAGVAALHGDESPESAAAWSAGGGAAGQGMSQLARLLSTPTGAKLGPLLAAIAAMTGIESLGAGVGGTMGAGLGTFGMARSIANSALRKPGAVGKLRWASEDIGQKAGTLGAGAADQLRATRRRSQD